MEIAVAPSPSPKAAGERRGLLFVHTGHGKGKSTVDFELALRAHRRGKAVKIYQLMKAPSARFGEQRVFEQLSLPIDGLGDGFSWRSRDLEHSAQLARDGWARAQATHAHVLLTGRDAPQKLTVIADTVTEMVLVKRHFQAGVPVQRGIED